MTILTESARASLNGKDLGDVPAGLHVSSVPLEPGRVSVRLERAGQPIITFSPPEPISAMPIRTDRLTYSYSNVFQEEFERLFGKR